MRNYMNFLPVRLCYLALATTTTKFALSTGRQASALKGRNIFRNRGDNERERQHLSTNSLPPAGGGGRVRGAHRAHEVYGTEPGSDRRELHCLKPCAQSQLTHAAAAPDAANATSHRQPTTAGGCNEGGNLRGSFALLASNCDQCHRYASEHLRLVGNSKENSSTPYHEKKGKNNFTLSHTVLRPSVRHHHSVHPRAHFNLIPLFVFTLLLQLQIRPFDCKSIIKESGTAANQHLTPAASEELGPLGYLFTKIGTEFNEPDAQLPTVRSPSRLLDRSIVEDLEKFETNTPATSSITRTQPTTTTASSPETSTSDQGEEDNEPGTECDDDDAQGCARLSGDEPTEGANLTDHARLVNLQTSLQEKIRRSLMGTRRAGMIAFERLSLSGACSASFMDLVSGLSGLKSFAFKFLDASAKLPSGVMYGLLSDFGDFDQCVSIKSGPSYAPLEDSETNEPSYTGKYCLISVRMNYHLTLEKNITVPEGIIPDGLLWDDLIRNYWTTNSTKGFQVGVCLPSRCSDDDLNQLYSYVAASYNFAGKIIGCQDSAQMEAQSAPDQVQRIILCTLYALLTLTLLATALDRYWPQVDLQQQAAGLLKTRNEDTSKDKGMDRASSPIAVTNGKFKQLLQADYLGLVSALRCFSLSKNWSSFVRADQGQAMNNQWDNLYTGSDCAASGANANRPNRASNTNSISGSFESDEQQVASCTRCTSLISEANTMEQIERDLAVVAPDNLKRCLKIDVSLPEEVNIGGKRKEFESHKLGVKITQNTCKLTPQNGTHSRPNSSQLSSLSGLKLVVIIWVTIGHSFLYPSANNYQYYRSIINMKLTRDSVWFATTNFTLGIDMLLYMTGLGFVYKLVKSRSKQTSSSLSPARLRKNENSGANLVAEVPQMEPPGMKSEWSLLVGSRAVLILLAKKVLRFWPTYLTLIGVAIVAPLLADGPMWPEMVGRRLGEACRQNWWYNLAFVNNYLSEPSICLPSSWFISVLMQLFLIGALIIVLIQKSSLLVGLLTMGLLLLASCVASFSYAYFQLVRAPMIRMDESFVMEMDENIYRLYTSTFNNLGPFLIGMLGGFALRMSGDNNCPSYRKAAKISVFSRRGLQLITCQVLVALLVGLIAVAVLSSVFVQNYTPFWASIYWSLHRIGWAIVTGFVIHSCATGKLPLLNDLLSLSTFAPLSRLIPIAYLVYPMFTHFHSGMVRDGLHVSMYNMLTIYITRLVMTFSTALLIHLLVELPFCSIEELYLNRWLQCRTISNESYKKKYSPTSLSDATSSSNSKFHPLLAVAPLVDSQNSYSEDRSSLEFMDQDQNEQQKTKIEQS